MNNLNLTVVGNLARDPELRFTPNGTAVAKFSIAFNPRTLDKQTGEWRDGTPSFFECVVWRQLAENVAESLTKGMRVVVAGRLRTEEWEDEKTKEKRSRQVLDVEAIGADLTYATVKVQKMSRANETSSDDPWASATPARPAQPATA